MWSYDPASAEAHAALAFLKSYGAPDSLLIQHPRPMINPLSTIPSDVENLMLLQLYDMQELYTQNAVTLYAGAVHDWTLNLVEQPQLPMPPIPDLPNLIAPMVELLFGACGIDAPLVVACPSLALRLVRRAGVAPGDPKE
jgi:hypothetical protein